MCSRSSVDQVPAQWTHADVIVPADGTPAHHATFTKSEKQRKQIKHALRKNKDLIKNGN